MSEPGPRRGTNLPRMGDFNQSVVLEAVRRSGAGLSRSEIAEVTGLSAQAVTNIARRLLEEGLVLEAGRTIRGPGKPRTLLKLNAARELAVGVHLDPSVTTVVILDLAGDVVAHARERTAVGAPSAVIDAIVDAIERLIGSSGVDRERIVGVGVAAPGPLDTAGTIIDPPKLDGWHRVALRDELRAATAMPLLLDKDTTASAVAELWRGVERTASSFLFVYLGTGIGAGLVMGHEVVRGVSGNAGEIGHIMVDPDGPVCTCGARGCVAVVCTPQAIVERAEREGVLVAGDETPDARFTGLCDRARAGDRGAVRVLETAAEHLSRAISVLTNMLDVDRVVLGGPSWSRLESVYLRVLPGLLAAQSATAAMRTLPVTGAVAGEDVAAVGAACLVLDAVHSPHAATLFLPAGDPA
ncbi:MULTISPECIES: ROK family protein [unclassified Microbacterium]|uniref:ROK family protein n=1 Tax=unclassified Microbacterium TaxID=2609290 RepID=UPI00300FCD5C